MGKNLPSRIRNREKWANMPYKGFSCKGCGHPDYVHFMFAGRCTHGEMKPKDGLDCCCQSMDSIALIKGENKPFITAKQAEELTNEMLEE